MVHKDAKIKISVKIVRHEHPESARHLLAELLLNQYLAAEEEKSRAAVEMKDADDALESIYLKAEQLGFSPESISEEVEAMKADCGLN